MNHLGLFEGIGGFSYAAKKMGWKTVAWCEINPFCQKVLKYHFTEAAQFANIKTTNFKPYANKIDILTGGFPCQPYSTAGKRLGKEDDRHLWPEMLRAIREIKPVWIVGENVRGLTNWNGGVVFDEVQVDLENEGYEIIPFILPACGINAPHKRERVWFIANSASVRRIQGVKRDETKFCNKNGSIGTFANSDSAGLQVGVFSRFKSVSGSAETFQRRESSRDNSTNDWNQFPTQPPICGGNDGIPRELDGITFSRWRRESIKAYGNAIVPQVALQIFKAIEQFNLLNPSLP
jgi:DNA (cytosine-5)-methyltransferase 1